MRRADYYAHVVLAEGAWRALDAATRHAQLDELSRHYDVGLKDDVIVLADRSRASFAAFFAAARLFASEEEQGAAAADAPVAWLCVTELLDPTVELHRSIFPERLPPEALRGEDQLAWLRRCGMRRALTRSSLTAAALKVHLRPLSPPSADECHGFPPPLSTRADCPAARQVHEPACAAIERCERLQRSLLQQADEVVRAVVSCYALLSDDASQPEGEPPLDEWLSLLGQVRCRLLTAAGDGADAPLTAS